MSNKTEFRLKTKHLFKIIAFIKKTKVVGTFKDFQSLAEIKDEHEKNLKAFDVFDSFLTLLETNEEDVYELLAALKEVTVEDIQEQDLSETFAMFSSIFNNETVKSFF